MSFTDIANLTDKRAETFTFTEAEADDVLAKTLGQGDFLRLKDNHVTVRQLEYLAKKELNLRMHAVTLAEYHKVRRIPRGLRILLKPTLCRESKLFIEKWRQILNKCSLDLLILTVQELQRSLDKVREEVEEVKGKLKACTPIEEWKKILDDLNRNIDLQKIELEKTKLRKFKRDTLDYQNDSVYTWVETLEAYNRNRLYRRQGGESDVSSSSAEDTPQDNRGTTNTENNQNKEQLSGDRQTQGSNTGPPPFLERGRGRGRPGGGEAARGSYPFTRSRNYQGQRQQW